jgi:hypothetical protein
MTGHPEPIRLILARADLPFSEQARQRASPIENEHARPVRPWRQERSKGIRPVVRPVAPSTTLLGDGKPL